MALALTGCASTDYDRYAKAQTDMATARHNADAEKYKAFAAIATSGDSTSKVAAVMAMAMGGNSGAQNAIQAPQASQALQWASILVPGLTQVAGMRYNYLSQQTASNNATALGASTNATMLGIAGKIQAPVVTLPQANVSTTTTTDSHNSTLSGTGTLGSGAYSTQDRHDVTSPAPLVITPVIAQTPVVITPVITQTPIVITPVTPTTPAP
jgi:hypothetical protein